MYANVVKDEDGEWLFKILQTMNKPLRNSQHHIPENLKIELCDVAGRSKGWGIVEFDTPEAVGPACQS